MSKVYRKEEAFSLIELSIVIVIIGFIVAGITAGSSLIKQASLRSTITDLQSYVTSYNSFQSFYGGVPGDLASASNYFGDDCAGAGNEDTCDGNNNGVIEFSATSGLNEINAAWKHLELAGMIGSGFEVLQDNATTTIGTSAPVSKISGAGYMMAGSTTSGGSIGTSNFSTPFDASTNAVFVAKETLSSSLNNGAMTPEDAFNIDRKIDDGVIISNSFLGADSGDFRAADGADASTSSCVDSDGDYNIDTSSFACVVGLALD